LGDAAAATNNDNDSDTGGVTTTAIVKARDLRSSIVPMEGDASLRKKNTQQPTTTKTLRWEGGAVVQCVVGGRW
jgi:hypothetical protein